MDEIAHCEGNKLAIKKQLTNYFMAVCDSRDPYINKDKFCH